MSLVIVGSIGLDTISTPAGSVTDALGGSAVYGAISGSYFCPVSIVGVLGSDYPSYGLEVLKKHGVNLEGLHHKEGKTFRWCGKYTEWNRAETLLTELNVFAEFSPQLPQSYQSAKSILLGNIHPELQLQVLQQTDTCAHRACDTMNYWIDLCPGELMKVIKSVQIVFMNEDEAKEFSGERNIFSASKAILACGPKWVIIKRGEYGSVAISESDLFFSPAYPVERVVDPTGAGDCFAGAFMAYIAGGEALDLPLIKDAVRYGTVMAAYNVQGFSVESIIGKKREEIDHAKELLNKWTS